MTLRISVTTLDGFRYHRSRVEEGGTWEDFIAELQEHRDTEAMRVGRAWHSLLGKYGGANLQWDAETERFEWRDGEPESEGVRFVLPAKPFPIVMPDDWEVPRVRKFWTGEEEILLSGRLDGIAADEQAIEFKTTQRAINLEKYLESYQWRCYLVLCTWLSAVRYEIVQLRAAKSKHEEEDVYRVVAHRSFTADRYFGMEADVRREVGDYVRALRQWEAEGKLRIGEDGRVVKTDAKA